jgi:hypothetical protein
MEPRALGPLIIGVGVVLTLVGVAVYYGGFSWFGRLPGDIRYEGNNTRVFIPITSMLLASVILTLLANLARRWF